MDEIKKLTEKEFKEFLKTLNYDEKIKIIERHSQKNTIRIIKENEFKGDNK